VCNHPAQLLGDNSSIPNRSGKLARLTEMLERRKTIAENTIGAGEGWQTELSNEQLKESLPCGGRPSASDNFEG
jgi:hypothetical protein